MQRVLWGAPLYESTFGFRGGDRQPWLVGGSGGASGQVVSNPRPRALSPEIESGRRRTKVHEALAAALAYELSLGAIDGRGWSTASATAPEERSPIPDRLQAFLNFLLF